MLSSVLSSPTAILSSPNDSPTPSRPSDFRPEPFLLPFLTIHRRIHLRFQIWVHTFRSQFRTLGLLFGGVGVLWWRVLWWVAR